MTPNLVAELTTPSSLKPVTAIEGIGLAFVGGVGSFGVMFGPWGNGFADVLIFAGCTVGTIVVYLLLRWFMPKARWRCRTVSVLLVFPIFITLAYFTSRPPVEKTLAYMIGGPVPAGVHDASVRCYWWDGQVYLARFRADPQAIASVLASRKFKPADPDLPLAGQWFEAFMFASIVDSTWKQFPPVTRPQIYESSGSMPSSPDLTLMTSFMVDDATGECWMMFCWT